MLLHFGKPWRKLTTLTQFLVHKRAQIFSWNPLNLWDFIRNKLIVNVRSVDFAQENVVNFILSEFFMLGAESFVENLVHKVELFVCEIHFKFSVKGSMQGGSDWLNFFFSVFQFNHVRVWAACVSPAEGECLLITRPSLEKQFVLGIEKEDAECSMRHWPTFREIFVGMSCPFINGSKEMIVKRNWNQLV